MPPEALAFARPDAGAANTVSPTAIPAKGARPGAFSNGAG